MRRIIIGCITAILVLMPTRNAMAYEQSIRDEITAGEQSVTDLNEGQIKTSELADYYREVLNLTDYDAPVQKLKENWFILNDKKQAQDELIRNLNEQLNAYQQNFIGSFHLTGYCPCVSCSGGWGAATATGAVPEDGTTIAVDPRVIPYGTRVYIEGVGYRVAQDCGGAIKNNRIDIYVNHHSDCFKAEYNQKSARVWRVD